MDTPLEAFLAALPKESAARLAKGPELEAWLADVIARARAGAAKVKLAPERFAEFLGGKLKGPDPRAEAEQLRLPELYLAAAALAQDPEAIRELDALIRLWVEREVQKVRAPSLLDDALNEVRALVLVGQGTPPAIGQYGGRGELGAWIRVVAVREVLRLHKKGTPEREHGSPGELEALASSADDPELGFLRGHYRDAFRTAFRAAVASLEPRDRNLLRQSFLDGLSIDELAELYHVHRATAARWLVKAREALAEATRARIREQIRVGSGELESILALVGSKLEISMRAFGSEGEGGTQT